MYSKAAVRFISIIDFCFIFMSAILLLAFLAEPAYAYVDPSVMTYTIQAIAGVAVALSAVFGVAYRRIRRKFMHVFHIDENAGKIVESDAERIQPSQKNDIDEQALKAGIPALQRDQSSGKAAMKFSWKRRLLTSFIVSTSLVLTVCFVSPCELVASNENEFALGFDLIWPVMALFSVAIVAAMTLLISLVRGRVFLILNGILAAISVGFLVQLLFLNVNLPVADGGELNLFDYKRITVLDTVAWVALIVAAIVLLLRKPAIAMRCVIMASVFVVVVQGAYAATIFAHHNGGYDYAFISKEGMFELEPQNNVVVFVLDTIDNRVFAEMVQDYPDYFEGLTGFTVFTDVAGAMIPTRYAVPYLLTGQYPDSNETIDKYMSARYDRSSFLDDVNKEDYSVGIYSDASLGTKETIRNIADDTINIHVADSESASKEMNTAGVFLTLTQCSLFKDVPWLLKPLFWFDTNSTNNAMLNKQPDSDSASQLGAYVLDDALFYENLIESPVSISDSDYAGAFRFYHLNGMHVPIEVNENAQKVELDASDDIEQCGLGGQNIINQGLGNFTIINEYINQLKDLGLYDNTAILITADHGISMVGETERWYTMPPSIDNPATPIFLYKPAQTPEEAAAPLAFSNAPIGHEEFIPTILDAIGADSSAYGSAVFEISEDDERTRYSYMTLSDGNGHATAIRKYSIHGDVADLKNWEYTGDEWEITSW